MIKLFLKLNILGLIMNICNSLVSQVRHLSHEAYELYQNRPPLYDIGISLYRSIVVPLGAGAAADFIGLNRWNPFSSLMVIATFGSVFIPKEASSLINRCRLNKLSKNQSHKNVALICLANADWSGGATRLGKNAMHIFNSLSNDNSIILKRIGCIEDVNKAITEITGEGRNITTLFISAHGKPTGMLFGNVNMDRENAKSIKWNQLDKNADIILRSCSTGKPLKEERNLAEVIQDLAGSTRHVFAPKDNAETDSLRIDATGKTKYVFA